MLPPDSWAWFHRLTNPLVQALVRRNVSPSAVTLTGLGVVLASCLWLVLARRILPFCLLVTAGALLDSVDGAVARAGGRVTKFGAYLDALCDRYSEAAVILAVAAVTGYWALSLVALAGGMLVSYAKARAAMEAPVANREWPDLMERTERGIFYIVGLAVSQVVPWKPFGHDLFWWTLIVFCVLVHATVLQRIRRAKRLIEARSG